MIYFLEGIRTKDKFYDALKQFPSLEVMQKWLDANYPDWVYYEATVKRKP